MNVPPGAEAPPGSEAAGISVGSVPHSRGAGRRQGKALIVSLAVVRQPWEVRYRHLNFFPVLRARGSARHCVIHDPVETIRPHEIALILPHSAIAQSGRDTLQR